MPDKHSAGKPKCYVREDIQDSKRENVRNKVCSHLNADYLNESDKNYYCILHFPNKEKKDDFLEAFNNKLDKSDYCFEWVWFPQLILAAFTFEKAVYFNNAYFSDYLLLKGSEFLGEANFEAAVFNVCALFAATRFHKRVIFKSCVFNCDLISFANAKFKYSEGGIVTVQFDSARFKGNFYFQSKEILGVVNFSKAEFEKLAMFDDSEFKSGTNFSNANFLGEASFEKVKFFSGADFKWSTFSHNTYFDQTEFWESTSFNSAYFTTDSDILFRETKFKKHVDFSYATFSGFVTFDTQRFERVFSESNILNLRYARLEAPDKLSFINVLLFPNWFIGIDSRKINFTNVTWKNISNYFPKHDINAELEKRKMHNKNQLFRITCLELAENAETNSRFSEASRFRLMAFECERLKKNELILNKFFQIKDLLKTKINCSLLSIKFYSEILKLIKGIAKQIISIRIDIFHRLYHWTSNYGESWAWALSGLIIGLFLFAVVFYLTNFQVCPMDKPLTISIQQSLCETRTLNFGEAILHSLATATFQNIEYQKPVTIVGEIIRILEKILAPLQATLLALAIRRKFMR